MVGARVDSWREPWGRNQASESRVRSVSPNAAQGQKPATRLLSLAKEQENMWAQLVTSSSALEGQLRALRAEHEVLKLESQALRRCLDRAGLLSASDVEQEMRQCGVGALMEAGAISESRSVQMVAAAKQSAAAFVKAGLANGNGGNAGNGGNSRQLERSSRAQSPGGAYRQPTSIPTPTFPGPASDNLHVAGLERATRLPARTVSPPRRGAQGDGPSRPVIIGGGGRRPASVGRLQVEEPSPTTADQEQTLNQLLQPFLKGGAAAAVEQHAIQALQRFLKGAPDLMRRWHGPGSPLVAVSRAGRADVARMLLRAGASTNDADSKGVTPLHIAVFDGNADLCKVLLSARADVEAADRHGQTPLFFAPGPEICRLLVERRAEVGALNRKGQSALHLAGRAGFHEVLNWLSARAGRQIVDLRDHHGNTAQMYGQQALAASMGRGPSDGTLASQAGATVGDQAVAITRQSEAAVSAPSKPEVVASHQEFKLCQEPEEYSLATGGNTTPDARCHTDANEGDSKPGVELGGLSAAAALEAAAQVASAAVAAAAATTWAEQENGPTQQALQTPQPLHLEEVLDECW